MAVLVYVDDLILMGNDPDLCASFKKYLHECFSIEDPATLKYFLGIEVARNPDGLFLCQRQYALDIIEECGLLGSRPASTPMEVNHKLAMATGASLSQAT